MRRKRTSSLVATNKNQMWLIHMCRYARSASWNKFICRATKCYTPRTGIYKAFDFQSTMEKKLYTRTLNKYTLNLQAAAAFTVSFWKYDKIETRKCVRFLWQGFPTKRFMIICEKKGNRLLSINSVHLTPGSILREFFAGSLQTWQKGQPKWNRCVYKCMCHDDYDYAFCLAVVVVVIIMIVALCRPFYDVYLSSWILVMQDIMEYETYASKCYQDKVTSAFWVEKCGTKHDAFSFSTYTNKCFERERVYKSW